MNPFNINYGPLQDKFLQFYQKFNNAINEIINNASLTGTTLRLHRYAAPDITVNLASLASVGAQYSFFEASAGTFNVPDQYFTIIGCRTATGAITVNLPANPSGEPRICIVVDMDDNADNYPITVQRTAAPAFSFTISKPAYGVMFIWDTVAPQGWVIALDFTGQSTGPGLPPGTLDGQNLIWDQASGQWVPAYSVITDYDTAVPDASSVTITPANPLIPGSECGSVSIQASDVMLTTYVCDTNQYSLIGATGSGIWLSNYNASYQTGLNLNHILGSIWFSDNPGVAGSISFPQGVEIKRFLAPPTTITDKIYNVSGNLYWDGKLICTSPCGGSTIVTPITAPGSYSTPVPGGAVKLLYHIIGMLSGAVNITLPGVADAPTGFQVVIKRQSAPKVDVDVTIIPNSPFFDSIDGSVSYKLNDTPFQSIVLTARNMGSGVRWIVEAEHLESPDYNSLSFAPSASPINIGMVIKRHQVISVGPFLVSSPNTSIVLPLVANQQPTLITIRRVDSSWFGFGHTNKRLTIVPPGSDTLALPPPYSSGYSITRPFQSITFAYNPGLAQWEPIGKWDEDSSPNYIRNFATADHTGPFTPPTYPFESQYAQVIECDTSAGNVTVNLPTSPVPIPQRYAELIIKKIAAPNTVFINGGTQNIDGASSITITAPFGSVRLVHTGVQWVRI